MDLPADLIMDTAKSPDSIEQGGLSIHHQQVAPMKPDCFKISQLIKTAKAPLVIIGRVLRMQEQKV